MKYPRTGVVALLAIATAVTAPLAVSAAEPEVAQPVIDLPDVTAPTVGGAPNEAELQDLQAIAKQSGMSLEAAIDRYAWNDNFALAVAEIQEAAPEAFTMAEIVDANTAWVAFAGDVPADARDILARFNRAHGGVSVDVQADWGYTATSLEQAIEEVHYAVLDAPGVRDASTTFDSATGGITSTVVLANDASTSAIVDLQALSIKSLASARGGISTKIATAVTVSNQPVLGGDDSSSYHHGGEALSTCSSGFGTKNVAGARGISTAGHCSNSQSDDGSSLTYRAGHVGTHGDFQWHTGPKPETDDFYAGSSSSTEVNLRDVSARGTPVVGQSLCKNGKNGHQDCQGVRKINVCYSGMCNLVQMNARLAESGDSGGPVYSGNTAYGLHQGWHYDPVWPFDRDLFSRADRIDNALGITVAIS
jgi:hypothetical protein